jgi:hypothetical protein
MQNVYTDKAKKKKKKAFQFEPKTSRRHTQRLTYNLTCWNLIIRQSDLRTGLIYSGFDCSFCISSNICLY